MESNVIADTVAEATEAATTDEMSVLEGGTPTVDQTVESVAAPAQNALEANVAALTAEVARLTALVSERDDYIARLKAESIGHRQARKTAQDDLARANAAYAEQVASWNATTAKLEADVQRLTLENSDLALTAQSATVEAIRIRIAAETGIPSALAVRLTGNTEEEIRRDALSLRAMIPAQTRLVADAGAPIEAAPSVDDIYAKKRAKYQKM